MPAEVSQAAVPAVLHKHFTPHKIKRTSRVSNRIRSSTENTQAKNKNLKRSSTVIANTKVEKSSREKQASISVYDEDFDDNEKEEINSNIVCNKFEFCDINYINSTIYILILIVKHDV